MGAHMAIDPISLQQLRNASEDAQDLEHYINDDVPALIPTRLGGPKPNWAKALSDIDASFQQFLVNSGYQSIGEYGAGLDITAANQIFSKDGEFYRAGPSLALPYTTTGDWATEGANFVAIGDASLRQELSATTGAEKIGFRQAGVGAVPRSQDEKNKETVSITDYGADPSGVLDSRDAIIKAADYLSSLGGGRLYYPPGRYRITAPLTFGDGSNSASSSKHHNIVHYGSGVGTSLDTTMPRGGTEIFYDGAVIDAGAVGFAGPMHGICFEDIHIDCNGKAAWGVNVVHVTDSFFKNVSTIRATKIGWRFSTRVSNPPGTAYGCSNNMVIHCNNFFPAHRDCIGISLTSGSPFSGPLLTDPANNDFIGGEYFYGDSANSRGVYLSGTDNNTFTGCQFIPLTDTSFGYSVFFEQWGGDPMFPSENVFINIGSSDQVGGTSGTAGNTFLVLQEGDGTPIPMLPYVNVQTHTGKQVVQGKRTYRTHDLKQETLVGVNQDTTSASYVPVPGLTATLTNVLASSWIRVTLTARVGKLVAGAGEFILYLNGVAQLATRTAVPANVQFQNTAMSFIAPVPFTGDFAAGMYFASDDGNIVRVTHGVLIMEALY